MEQASYHKKHEREKSRTKPKMTKVKQARIDNFFRHYMTIVDTYRNESDMDEE